MNDTVISKNGNIISNTQSDISTKIQIPAFLFIDGYSVTVSDGYFRTETNDYGWDIIYYYHDKTEKQHYVVISSHAQLRTSNKYNIPISILILILIIFYFVFYQ